MESDRINDVDDNWGTIEAAIRGLQANASLFRLFPSGTTIDDAIASFYADQPIKSMRMGTMSLDGDLKGLIIFKTDANYGKVIIMDYWASGIDIYKLSGGVTAILAGTLPTNNLIFSATYIMQGS